MVTVDTFTAIINQLLPEPHAGLLDGILFGTKATLSKHFIAALTTTGTLHIVALSGMNITILGSLIDLLLLRFVSRRIASVLTVAIIIGFVWLVGVQASIVRAAIMGCIALLATIFGRQTWSLLSFLLAVGVMLLVKPDWIADLSFQLSALATLGIILFGRKNDNTAGRHTISSTVTRGKSQRVLSRVFPQEHPQGAPSWGSPDARHPQTPAFLTEAQQIRVSTKAVNWLFSLISDDLRITLAAQVFTTPLILFTFHRISLVSPLTNILIGWVIPPLTALGLFSVVLGWIFLPLGAPVAWVCWLLLQYVILVVDLTAKIPVASVGF